MTPKKTILIAILTIISACYQPKINTNIKFNNNQTLNLAKKFSIINNHCSGTPQNDTMAQIIKNYLTNFADNIVEDTFLIKTNNQNIIAKNIYASIKTNNINRKKIILACNYDSPKISDTTNFCSSAAALTLTLAKNIAENKNQYPNVDLIFFDGKECVSADTNLNKIRKKCLGSQHWAKNVDNSEYLCAIYFYIPIHKNGIYAKEGHANLYATKFLRILSEIENQLYNSNSLFTEEIASPLNGDNCFINKDANIPTVAICSHTTKINRRNEEEQTPHIDDKFENIDTIMLNKLGEIILQFCSQEKI